MSYYLSLKNPVEIRRGFLETAKDSVELLKSQYALRELRVRKKKYLNHLVDIIAELDMLMVRLDEVTPEHDSSAMPEVAKHMRTRNTSEEKVNKESKSEKTVSKTPKKSVKKKAKVVKKEEPKLSEEEQAVQAMSKLEQKLASIESKLNKL